MKTTQLILFSIMCLIISINGSDAQIVHNDLNPDKVISMPAETYGTEEIDLDGDNTDDIKFSYYNYPSFTLWNLGIAQPDTNNPTIEILYDNTIPQSQIGDYYVKKLTANNDISSTSSYSDDYPQVGDIYNDNFKGGGDLYIGFRLVAGGSDYKYGWMAVSLTGLTEMTFTIKEYAYQNTVNTPIKAGQTSGVGIEHVDLSSAGFGLYPNPVTNYVNITNPLGNIVEQVQVYSLQGQLIGQWINPTFPLKLETSSWRSGTYLLEMTGGANIYRELLIKK